MTTEVVERNNVNLDAIEEFENLTEGKAREEADRLKGVRLGLGVYTQRQKDYYMVRTKIAAGLLDIGDLSKLAGAADNYSNGSIHLTTRQDVQFYFVKHAAAPKLLKQLHEDGVTTLGAGGNTIRNITVCGHGGDYGKEKSDVSSVAKAVSGYFLGHDLAKGLPRKFKITFCGAPSGCGGALKDDVAFIVARNHDDGGYGFKMYAGGGQGAMPRLAKLLESFIPANQVHLHILAVLRIFDRHGSRVNRNRARLKFLIEKIGMEMFTTLYREELDNIRAEGTPELEIDEPVKIAAPPLSGSILIKVPTGDLTSDKLRKLGALLKKSDGAALRITDTADLLITGVPEERLPKLTHALEVIGLETEKPGANSFVTSCNGAATCNEGITNSKALAKRLELFASKLNGDSKLRFAVSGCPNACGNHHTADIGLQGSAKRVEGVLVPHYQIYLGGSLAENPELAVPIIKVPAKRTIEAVERLVEFFNAELKEGESICGLVDSYRAERIEAVLTPYTWLDPVTAGKEQYLDWDSATEFSLEDVGPGECAGAALDIIDAYFNQARHGISSAKSESSAEAALLLCHNASIAAARALLVTYGVDPASDEETASEFHKRIVTRGFVNESYLTALDGPAGTGDAEPVIELTEKFIEACLAAYTRINAQANLEDGEEKDAGHGAAPVETIDLTGVACPFNYVKVKLALELMPSGSLLQALLDNGSPTKNVPQSLNNDGHQIVSITPRGGQSLLLVQKG